MSFYLFVYILSTENVMLDWGWLRTTFWHEDSHKAQNTKNELRKKQEKNSIFLVSTRSSLFFRKFSFLKKKMELRHLQKWDKLSLQVTIFKQACCFIEFKWKEKTDLEWDTVSRELRNCELSRKKKLLKTVNWEMDENAIKPLITLCVFLRRHHHLC